MRLCLLTAQRKAKVFNMKWTEIEGSEWTIPRAPREKDNAGVLVLPNAALAIIEAQPELGEQPVCVRRAQQRPGHRHERMQGCASIGSAASRAGACTILRRTARSLMSRAGVRPDIAERVMGHAIGGVEGIYDRHSYKAEKADALQRLAAYRLHRASAR